MFLQENMDLTWTIHGLSMDLGAVRPQADASLFIVFQVVKSFLTNLMDRGIVVWYVLFMIIFN